jgi:hypothetical protein
VGVVKRWIEGASEGSEQGASLPPCSVWPEAEAKVCAIREAALGLGWSDDDLLGGRCLHPFPFGPHALVCYLSEGRSIGEVTGDFIEIRLAGAKPARILRFYNPDVPHPWVRGVVL